ncbi:unnamed protein product [Heligmosomoides polygyrus]|uniref:Reverse transcriptase domain-containing protein n=1 Tax=Heligmosomoides polygyrus TaxID=6339 RepID=A0A3P8F7Y4_HELPZ|nr:unnamed protein product [Heligmosomoides polygyrus]
MKQRLRLLRCQLMHQITVLLLLLFHQLLSAEVVFHDLRLTLSFCPIPVLFSVRRPVPHATLESVERELNRLQEMGGITPITHSQWAGPIVCMKKPNGKVRVCADFSTGLNKALQSFDYPLPVPEDIFVSLNGDTVFSQIDLSDAYLQIELSEESKKKVVINTHKGLFKYNRLPFGIKTAPGIFQQVMNKMVAGLKVVTTYLDDILVCGTTEEEHEKIIVAADACEYGIGCVISHRYADGSEKSIAGVRSNPFPNHYSSFDITVQQTTDNHLTTLHDVSNDNMLTVNLNAE